MHLSDVSKLVSFQGQPFRWFSGGDAAMDYLKGLALQIYTSNPPKGTKVGDRIDRQNATAKLLNCLASVGRKDSPVAIALQVRSSPLPRYPRGHQKALEALIADGFVECVTVANKTGSYHAFKNSNGLMSAPSNKAMKATAGTYKLSAKSWETLDVKGFDPSSLMPDPDRSVIVKANRADGVSDLGNFDDESGKIIVPPPHPELALWIGQIGSYNALLRGFKFSLDGHPTAATVFDLHRVFNGADYCGGGRFYSEFVHMAGKDRQRVIVNNQPLVSSDYGSLYPRLSMALAGIPWPDGDLYKLDGHSREHVKLVWTSALGTKNKTGISDKTNNAVKAKGGDGPAILATIKAKYVGIDAVLGRGLSLLLQRAEARALEVFLSGFVTKGKPLLPVHDGFYFLATDKALFESLRPEAEAAIFNELGRQYEGKTLGTLLGCNFVKPLMSLPMA